MINDTQPNKTKLLFEKYEFDIITVKLSGLKRKLLFKRKK
jgi:hypothetical protein